MNRLLLDVLAAFALSGALLFIPGCSSDDGGSTSSGSSSGGSSSGSRGGRSTSSSSSGGSSESSSTSESFGFCLNGNGWTCPSATDKTACIKGNCAKCSEDASQCSSNDSGDSRGAGDDGM